MVKLAGMEGTPADEMRDGEGSSPAQAAGDPALMCPIHNVPWFKKGKMRDFAHPQDGGWCNQAVVMAAQKAIAEVAAAPNAIQVAYEVAEVHEPDPEQGQPAFPGTDNDLPS